MTATCIKVYKRYVNIFSCMLDNRHIHARQFKSICLYINVFFITSDNLTLSEVMACKNPSPWPGAWNFLCFIICAIFFDVFQFHTSKNFFKNSLHPLSTSHGFLLQLSIIRMLSDLSTANNTVQKILYNDYYDDMDWQLHITEWICL